MTPAVQIALVLFVAVLALGGMAALLMNQRQKERDKSLNIITGGAHVGKKGDGKDKQMAKRREELARKLKEAEDEAKAKRKKSGVSLKDMIQQAGFDAPVSKFWLFSFIIGGLLSGLISLTGLAPLAKLLFSFFFVFGLPRVFLKWKAGRRQRKFLEEFSDALEAMVRLLQAGMPVTEAISMVGREYEGPVGDEMAIMYNDQKIGMTIGESAERCAKRMPLTEVQMFATALTIQSETGSSLSEVLMNLAAVIRARFRLKRKVKALSSEAKASAAIIGCLPLLVAGGLYLVNPEYIMLLFTTKTGKMLSYAATFWMSCGILIMRQMINFKV